MWPGGMPSIMSPPMVFGGVMRFSFCRRLQNHTRTTSFSSCRLSASDEISCADGFGCLWKCCSSAPFTDTSMLVRFFRFRPWAAILSMLVGEPVVESASSSHFCSSGFSLHMFLKLSCSASNRQMVPDVRLREAELDPALLELLRERLQVVGRRRVLLARAHVPVALQVMVMVVVVVVRRQVQLRRLAPQRGMQRRRRRRTLVMRGMVVAGRVVQHAVHGGGGVRVVLQRGAGAGGVVRAGVHRRVPPVRRGHPSAAAATAQRHWAGWEWAAAAAACSDQGSLGWSAAHGLPPSPPVTEPSPAGLGEGLEGTVMPPWWCVAAAATAAAAAAW
uniref:Uncharacterized protein n=1 Tax=Anopheles atroparvus TaxID=41427 RepID=A0A182J5K4_ANOAO